VVVGISAGDPSGIGPEVIEKALRDGRVRRRIVPVVFGDARALGARRGWERAAHPLGHRPVIPTLVEVTALADRHRRPGRPTLEGGRAQYAYLTAAIDAARAGHAEALCTAPVSKEQISRAGIPFMGHTEVLAEAFGREVLMLMDGPRVRVALATNHVPIARVSELLSAPKLVDQIALLSSSLARVLGRKPRIAVCGLNPHAGEGGLLGREDVEVIRPAVEQARALGFRVEGPLAADGLFARVSRLPYDAVLAMFHDQGLVAVKALDFERTVNVTLGLPVPRTSPDHGVAYDIAGSGRASARPMIAALLEAAELAGTPRSRRAPSPASPRPPPRGHVLRRRQTERAE
jgi:4-hydroxythreonine-4-phosphate dehydrogenase